MTTELPNIYYTRDEIALHNTEYDYWIVMGNKVFEFTNFAHPGGWIAHMPFAGGKLDATIAFSAMHGNSGSVKSTLMSHFKGYVTENGERTIADLSYDRRWQQNG